ncbi:hypothetical protein [Nonomuraea sp. NPDC049400]|uniref:hypothetical protein n=1 Tax=Nonomuraea sp. NPDC049400 TaxID=3364352 RepID=UPI0037BA7982
MATEWLSIVAGVVAVAFAIVMNGSVSGILQIVLLGVLGIAELVCFAVLVARAAIRLRG